MLQHYFLTGCTYTSYEYVAPTSQRGYLCVNECNYDRQVCIADKEKANQNLRMSYQRDMHYYKRCQEENPKKSSSYCQKPYREYAEGFNCEGIYDACFKTCGGKIIAVEKEL
ncbi:MAG: hypothetical protein Q9M36_09860 [Sulfurovum sp.]|nr:hypothetical protein [Sulfurovum sp.]